MEPPIIPMPGESEEQLRARIGEDAYHVLREGGTEAPWKGAYVDNHEPGVYRCRVCNTVLFSSDQKFDSKSGWPSFTDPAVKENIGTRDDSSLGMRRTEVFCKTCGSHLGHVFPDGPEDKGGMRYCINSISLDFEKKEG